MTTRRYKRLQHDFGGEMSSSRAVLQPVTRSAPAGLMDKRALDQHQADLLALQRHRNSKSNFKLTLDVPSGLGFVAIPGVLLQSLVWNSLGIYEVRFVTFLLTEHLRHSRTMNGYLTATFDQVEAQRIPRSFIARTIKNLEELGLVEVTHQGGHAGGARQNPSRYRLTFMNSSLRSVVTEYLPATNDWVEVELALLDGRRQRQKRHKAPSLKRRLNGQKNETNLVIINETIGEVPSSSETSVRPAENPLLGPDRLGGRRAR
jgi:hypothetical protein